MNVNQMFPSRYLRGAELAGPVNVTIAEIRQETAYKPGVGQTEIYVLYCKNARRGVVLSKALAFSIAQALGEPDTDKWAGRALTLFPQSMRVAGSDLVCIRARPAQSQPGSENQE